MVDSPAEIASPDHDDPLSSKVNFLIIGAGARGNAYALALTQSTHNAHISAVAEPVGFKRQQFGLKYIWQDREPRQDQAFETWQDYLDYELRRRKRAELGEPVLGCVDAVFICVLDALHAEIITAFAPLGLHLMSEKPLATTLQDCLKIYRSLKPPTEAAPNVVFSIGHVLHYSPHNILLRRLLLEDEAIGYVLSMEHTEPVGWWHFSHSYVRGNWRKESTAAPSLLTKSCHDIDFLLWLLCSPPTYPSQPLHLPSKVSSSGSLLYYKNARKPLLAGDATNCMSCLAEPSCIYSAKKIYQERHLGNGNAGWPVNIVDPEIEDLYRSGDHSGAYQRLGERLQEDYGSSTSRVASEQKRIDSRPWFGRCVYESDNDVCDDQFVTITWEDDMDPLDCPLGTGDFLGGRGGKTATFHMVAFTDKQCKRRGRIYGTKGEIEYDSKTIRVFDFATNQTRVHSPQQLGGGHGGGDSGLAMAFFNACQAVKSQDMTVTEAQDKYIGCTLEDVIRSHAMVFAAETARKDGIVIDWAKWWDTNVEEVIRR